MKEQDIDKIFRDKLANHTKQPLPQTWGKIHAALQSNLQNKKKRRAIIAWRMAAGLALVAGVAWLTVNFDEKNFDKNSAENVVIVSKITKEVTKETLKEVAVSKIEDSKTEISEIGVTKTKVQKIKDSGAEIAETTNKISQNKQKLAPEQVSEIVNQITEQQVAIQTLDIVAKTPNEIANKATNEDTIEVIVKLGNGNTEIDSTNIIASTTKKRTFLGKIWQKVREGETLTLRDVGVKPPKLPRFLRKTE